MKKLLSILAIAMIAIAPQAIAEMADKKEAMMEKKMEAPATTAVAFHADWCGGCKILGPKMKEVMNGLDEDTKAKFGFVKFDFTDDATKAASKTAAMENSLTGVYPEGKPSTGVVKLIDNATGSVLAKIHYKMSVEEITGVIKGVTARS